MKVYDLVLEAHDYEKHFYLEGPEMSDKEFKKICNSFLASGWKHAFETANKYDNSSCYSYDCCEFIVSKLKEKGFRNIDLATFSVPERNWAVSEVTDEDKKLLVTDENIEKARKVNILSK